MRFVVFSLIGVVYTLPHIVKICLLEPVVFILLIGGVFHIRSLCLLRFGLIVLFYLHVEFVIEPLEMNKDWLFSWSVAG
jgi:hypothetical protein